MSTSYWKPGDTIAVRDIRAGRVGAATPMRVMEDGPDRLVTYLAEGCTFHVAANARGLVKQGTDFDHLAALPYSGLHCVFFTFPMESFSLRATYAGKPRNSPTGT